MPNLTTALPKRTGDIETDYGSLYNAFISLVDELKQLLNNLDSGNVIEAASVKAQNIDAAQAKIKDAQIASLTANKLTAGIIDAGQIAVRGESDAGEMVLSGDTIVFYDKRGNKRGNARIIIGSDGGNDYIFTVMNRDGTKGIYINDSGNISLTGDIQTDRDCRIQGELRVGMQADNQTKGIEFYAMAYNQGGSDCVAKIVPYTPSGEDHPVGINIETRRGSGDVYIDGRKVLTVE